MRKGIGCIFLSLALVACEADTPAEGAPAGRESSISEGTALDDTVPIMGEERRILAFGDSLFAGYNVAKDDSYPATLQNALRATGVNAEVTNAGVSGDTTAAGLQRFAFTLDAQERAPDLVIIELGGNDLLRGIQPDQTRSNIEAMLKELQSRDIDALLMGMRAPPNYGPDFQAAFDRLYGDLAQQYGADLVPFFLESIYQSPDLFQSDRIHPTEEGIEQLVEATLSVVTEALPETDREN